MDPRTGLFQASADGSSLVFARMVFEAYVQSLHVMSDVYR